MRVVLVALLLNIVLADSQLTESPCGIDQTFCEEVEGYDDIIDELLKKSVATYDKFDLVDEVDEEPIGIAQRSKFIEDPLCTSRQHVIYPKVALSRRKKWQYILNKGPYRQGVKIEVCTIKDEECQYASRLPLGRKAVCEQKYFFRSLLTINNQTGVQSMKSFKMPSCCKCSIEIRNQAAP